MLVQHVQRLILTPNYPLNSLKAETKPDDPLIHHAKLMVSTKRHVSCD